MLLEVNVRCYFFDFLSMLLIYKGICLCNVKCFVRKPIYDAFNH